MSITALKVVTSATVACSFILAGNAITQSFMGVPALLIDFPTPASPSHAERARLLGRQWPVFWEVGNRFFRPLSTVGILLYGASAWAARQQGKGNWSLVAVAACCNILTAVHSAINMQPINERISALGGGGEQAKDGEKAEQYARRWGRLNLLRVVVPLVAGTLAMTQVLES
ncbi:hypothetical protein PG996_008624 [Apiospora saccharicola]|uniref:DUF1772-domain-containing protein n=1 Tax=Apiospora saccharicola TaxID=335842 RepID=A0ABR1UYG4_9PEZI